MSEFQLAKLKIASSNSNTHEVNLIPPTAAMSQITLHCLLLLACACVVVLAAAPEPTHMDHKNHKHMDMDMDHTNHDMDHTNHDMDHDMDHMNHDKNKTHEMHMMKMYFHFGVDETVLFEAWKITTVGGMIGSVIGIFLLGMLYEGLKYFREYLFKQYVANIQFSTVAITKESGHVSQVHKVEKHKMLSWAHTFQTGLHIIQIIVSYFLMLIFMTYNVWLCLAVVLGAGVGYFVFGWRKASVVDITEHCH